MERYGNCQEFAPDSNLFAFLAKEKIDSISIRSAKMKLIRFKKYKK